MAITALEHLVLTGLREHQILPQRPTMLELGESNWYGDVSVEQLEADMYRLISDPQDRQKRVEQLRAAAGARRPEMLYEIARIFFDFAVQPTEYSAVDPGTPGSKYRLDLNQPLPIDEQFDLVINIGTAEHIFNVHQFFKTAHDRTRTGGLMMHSAPFTGWPDHGFFNFQPTFFFDLARTNRYDIVSFICGRILPFEYVQLATHDDIPHLIKTKKIPEGSHINVVYRKMSDSDFQIPMQAYYAGVLSVESRKMWHQLR